MTDMQKIKSPGIWTLLIFFVMSCMIGSCNSQCCLKFDGVSCINCPENMHLYRGNCIFNLPNCKIYSNGFDCSQCNNGYRLENSVCILIPKLQQKSQAKPQPRSEQKPQIKAQIKDYNEFPILLPLDPSNPNQRSQRASMVDQILRGTHADIRKAEIVKAIDRIYTNNSKVIELVYRVNGPQKTQALYQGLMIADLETFVFQEVSFKKLENNQVVIGNAQKLNPNQSSQPINAQQNNTQQQNIIPQKSVPQTNIQSTGSLNILPETKLFDNLLVPQNSLIKPQSPPTSATSSIPNVQPSSVNPSQSLSTSSLPGTQQLSFSSTSQTYQTKANSAPNIPQDEYSSIKFVELSDIDALIDINFVIALNQINNKIPQLQGLTPTSILAQIGYNGSKISVVHYIITFEFEEKGKGTVTQEVKLKVIPSFSTVKIDSVTKRESSKTSLNSSPNTAKSPVTNTQPLTGEKISQKSSYTEISSNPAQADIFFLIFLDNLGKGLEKKLTENGQKLGENEILYAGRLESKDVVNFWVETRVTYANKTQQNFKVTGSQNKLTYEVKINDIVPIQEIKKIETKSQSKVQTIEVSKPTPIGNANTNQKPTVQTQIIKQFRQPKDFLPTDQNSVNSLTSVPYGSINPSSISSNSTSKNPNIAIPVPSNPAVQTPVNRPPLSVTGNAVSASPVTQTLVTPIPAIAITVPPKQQISLFSSKLFADINRTITEKAGGFDEIDPKLVQKDDNILKLVDYLMTGRIDRQNKKLYKAFIKNFGIKAEYKVYLIDMVTNSPRIEVTEGYVSYDLLRKKIFVISYGSIGF